MDKEQMFNQYYRLINKLVWKYYRQVNHKCSDTFEDLQAEGFLVFCEALETYNPDKAAFSTHLWNSLTTAFQRKGRHETKFHEIHYLSEIEIYTVNGDMPELQHYFHEALQEISEEAKTMLDFIFSTDEKVTIGNLQKQFVSTGIFKKTQFDCAIKRLKSWWRDNKNLVNLPKRCQNLQEILANLG